MTTKDSNRQEIPQNGFSEKDRQLMEQYLETHKERQRLAQQLQDMGPVAQEGEALADKDSYPGHFLILQQAKKDIFGMRDKDGRLSAKQDILMRQMSEEARKEILTILACARMYQEAGE